MTPTRAILQVADTGPLESLVVMLQSVGITCYLPDEELLTELRYMGLDTVLSSQDLVRGMGYDPPMELPRASIRDLSRSDTIYVDVKGHRNGPKVWRRWPHLRHRVLWYRINGGEPEHVIKSNEDFGDEINPPCPVLTPNQWYRLEYLECNRCRGTGESPPGDMCWECDGDGEKKVSWYKTPRYVCWPPFFRLPDYQKIREERATLKEYAVPLCLIHNFAGWGYGAMIPELQRLGVRVYGRGSPDGLLSHQECIRRLGQCLAMVHLKSNDAPGYALYESAAAGCPLVLTKRLIWRCQMQDLWESGVTCLTFDEETHAPLTDSDVRTCAAEIEGHLETLRNPTRNLELGRAACERLVQLCWSPKDSRDVGSLREFIERNFS